jgi:hypothetical protein
MNGRQTPSQRIFDFKQVMEVGAGIIFTRITVAGFADWSKIFLVFVFGNIKKFCFFIFVHQIQTLVPGVSGGQNAVKNIVAVFKTFDNGFRVADAQGEFRFVVGQERSRVF